MTKRKKKNIEELTNELLVSAEEYEQVQENWLWVRLGSVCEFKRGPFGSAIKKSMFVPKGEDTYKVYEQGNAIRKTMDYGDYYISREDFENLKGFEVNEGDIIVSCAGTIGETYIIPPNHERGVINQALMRVKTSKVLDKRYFLYAFDYYIKQLAKDNAKGSAMKNLPPLAELKQYVIPLPPLSEQKRIVKKVESLLSKIEEAKHLIEEAKETFEIRRAAILDKSFRGGFSQNREKESFKDLGEVSYLIPNSWNWMSVEDVCELISDCPHSTPKYIEDGEYPAIRSSDIHFGKVVISKAKRISQENYLERIKRVEPQKGDIIYCREGSGAIGKAVGKAGLLHDDKVCLAQRVVLLRPDKEKILPKYFAYVLNSPIMLRQVALNISQTTSPRINISTLKSLSLPIAPIEIQQSVVNIIESSLEIEEKANNFCNIGENLDTLKQSILSKAFRGELGTNDSSEESAIESLKQVLQEKVK